MHANICEQLLCPPKDRLGRPGLVGKAAISRTTGSWGSYLNSLILGFHIYKMGIITLIDA